MTSPKGEDAEFRGKTAFITGGAQGIGFAIAKRLGNNGAAIVIVDIDAEAGLRAVGELADLGISAAAVRCNVADEAEVARAVADAVSRFGGIDFVVNNAGRHLLEYAVAPTVLSASKWRKMLEVNVLGVVHCAAACRSTMASRGGGVVINISSTAGLIGNTAYGVSKLAVRGLTVGLAEEFAIDAIRVCAVAPGLVDSPAALEEIPAERYAEFVNTLQLVRRPGRMDDVAGLVHFLCSDDASFITGETIAISGGYPRRL